MQNWLEVAMVRFNYFGGVFETEPFYNSFTQDNKTEKK